MAESIITDNRLIGLTPDMSEDVLMEYTHSHIRHMLKTDFADFLKTPTSARLHSVVEQLLSYQDSHALGTRRNLEKKPKTAGE